MVILDEDVVAEQEVILPMIPSLEDSIQEISYSSPEPRSSSLSPVEVQPYPYRVYDKDITILECPWEWKVNMWTPNTCVDHVKVSTINTWSNQYVKRHFTWVLRKIAWIPRWVELFVWSLKLIETRIDSEHTYNFWGVILNKSDPANFRPGIIK